MKLSQSLLQLLYLTTITVFQAKHHMIEFTDKFFEAYHHSDPVNVLWNKYKVLCKDCMAYRKQNKNYLELPGILRDRQERNKGNAT